jgi:hypothetical protein
VKSSKPYAVTTQILSRVTNTKYSVSVTFLLFPEALSSRQNTFTKRRVRAEC